MDSSVWIFISIVALMWVLIVELKRHRTSAQFEKALDNCLAKFLITFSDGSAKSLELTKGALVATKPPILRTQFNQEHWIVSLHFDSVEDFDLLPAKLYLHIEGVGKVTLRKDLVRSKTVLYRAVVLTSQSLHYVSRRAVIGA